MGVGILFKAFTGAEEVDWHGPGTGQGSWAAEGHIGLHSQKV